MNTNSIFMWETLLSNADWDCFKTLTSREILKIRNPFLAEHCAFFGSHTFVPISWMCKKQTSVSHSSTESEIISLDAGLRLDGVTSLHNKHFFVIFNRLSLAWYEYLFVPFATSRMRLDDEECVTSFSRVAS